MANAQYEIKHGPLTDTYGLFVPSTINTGAQISADRIEDEGLRSEWFYTANAPLATKRGGKLLLGMGGNTAFNAIFGVDTKTVCDELRDGGYIHLDPRKRDLILRLERAGEVVFVEPNALGLKGNEVEYRQFPIRTGNYQKDATTARMPWVSAGFGAGYMLRIVMDNLITNNIPETTVFTFNPDHAAESVRDGEIIARASRLGIFDYGSYFDAGIRGVDDRSGLRGVLRTPAEGGAPEKTELETLVQKATKVGNVYAITEEDLAAIRSGKQ